MQHDTGEYPRSRAKSAVAAAQRLPNHGWQDVNIYRHPGTTRSIKSGNHMLRSLYKGAMDSSKLRLKTGVTIDQAIWDWEVQRVAIIQSLHTKMFLSNPIHPYSHHTTHVVPIEPRIIDDGLNHLPLLREWWASSACVGVALGVISQSLQLHINLPLQEDS